MHWRAALKVLLHGLPEPVEKIKVHTDTIIVPENAVFTTVYKAERKNTRKLGYYPESWRLPSWEDAYFRSCKDAFEVSAGEAIVTAEKAYVRDGVILRGAFSKTAFYTPPDPNTPIGDAQFEGAGTPIPPLDYSKS
jgi:hypothetical protein